MEGPNPNPNPNTNTNTNTNTVSTATDVIAGANHAQFGDYGVQSGDTTATISRMQQQTQTVNITLTFLNKWRDP